MPHSKPGSPGPALPGKNEPARIRLKLRLPPGERLTFHFDSNPGVEQPAGAQVVSSEHSAAPAASAALRLHAPGWLDAARRSAFWQRLRREIHPASPAWPLCFFILSLLVYLVTRLVQLPDFPIFFFTDEAIQTVLAADLVRDGFRSYTHELLPTYLVNGNQYNLSVSVYLQVIPYLVFGKSIWATRGVSALVSLLAPLSLGLILKNIFRSRYFWTAPLILALTPAWFLHSRTAFETVLAVSFYAGFLYCYLMYRMRSPVYIFPAAILAGLAFYSYSPMQMVLLVTAVLLILSDAPYHFRQRAWVVRALPLVLLLSAPYIRFLINHPDENIRHLQILSSYWTESISTTEKISRFFGEYLYGLNPAYWYIPNDHDLARHLMKGYGHLAAWSLPLTILGLLLAALRFKDPSRRVLLAALLAAPSGAALAQIGITRTLVMVIPAALLAGLGLNAALEWLSKRRFLSTLPAALTFLALCAGNFLMLDDALTNGPTWFNDFGLGGMQYGARQIFDEIRRTLEKSPGKQIILSPSWANGTDVTLRFFFENPVPFQLGSIEGYLNEHRPINRGTTFIVIPEEFRWLPGSPKFKDIQVEKFLPYPDGRPGFYFLHLSYADNIDQILAGEREARKGLVETTLRVGAENVQVRYSQLDMGSIDKLFDGNRDTLARSFEANPMRVEMEFHAPHAISGLSVRVGGTATRITTTLDPVNGGSPLVYSQQAAESPEPRDLRFDFGGSIPASRLRLAVRSVNDGEPAHVHVWEVILR